MSIDNRYEFVLLFDVKDGNPNGDPDAGNLPRVDAETGMGLMTDTSLKRKIRNFVGLIKDKPGYEIYVKERAVLNQQHARAYSESEEVRLALKKIEELSQLKKPTKKAGEEEKSYYEKLKKEVDSFHVEDIAQKWVCDNFYDVRTFGAVMSTSDSSTDLSNIKARAGQVRGPVQMTFARSIDPVVVAEHSLTVTAARKGDAPYEGQIGIQGRKHTIPYGLYQSHGFISSHLAQKTGFGEEDLELLLQALEQMFDHDRSAARGEMATRGLYVFKHNNALGNAPAHSLFDLIEITKKDESKPARNFSDYTVTIDEANLPSGVELIKRIG